MFLCKDITVLCRGGGYAAWLADSWGNATKIGKVLSQLLNVGFTPAPKTAYADGDVGGEAKRDEQNENRLLVSKVIYSLNWDDRRKRFQPEAPIEPVRHQFGKNFLTKQVKASLKPGGTLKLGLPMKQQKNPRTLY